MILFLASPASVAVNGAVIMADGGVSAADLSMAGLWPDPADVYAKP